MTKPPLILISPSVERKGVEFGDLSLSLSMPYPKGVMDAGGVPFVMPSTVSRPMIAECVRRSHGVLLTGGDDIEPRLYTKKLTPKLKKTVEVSPDGGQRDLQELMLIDEVFRQRKPVLAICRGHQLLNVAFGGSLYVDIEVQAKGAMNHKRMDKKNGIAHDVHLTEGSMLAKITGRQTLGVNSTHHQAVARPGKLFEVTGRSSDDVIESVELKAESAGRLPFLVSVQFHPERLAERHREHRAIFRRICASLCVEPQ